MSRKRVGLALGGGAARGIAHIGVIQVLQENGIPIDCVAGCSMGAVVGGIFCADADMYTIGKLATTLDERTFLDVGRPRDGLVKGKKAEELINSLCQNKSFSQCKVPFCATATDLVTASTIAIRKGKLSRAIRASISIPGVFEPVEWDEMMLVDGGVTDRVPINQCRNELNAEYIIAVDVAFRGWRRPKPRNMIETIYQSFETCDWFNVQRELPKSDIVLVPEVAEIDEKNLSDAAQCLEAGRQAALRAMTQIKNDLGL